MSKIAVFIASPFYIEGYYIYNYIQENFNNYDVDIYYSDKKSYVKLKNIHDNYNFTHKIFDMDIMIGFTEELFNSKHYLEKFNPKKFKKAQKIEKTFQSNNYEQIITTELNMNRFYSLDKRAKSTFILLPWRYNSNFSILDSNMFIDFNWVDEILVYSKNMKEDIKLLSNKLFEKTKIVPINFSDDNMNKYQHPDEVYTSKINYWDWDIDEVENKYDLYTFAFGLDFSNFDEFIHICENEFNDKNVSISYRLLYKDDEFVKKYFEENIVSRFKNIQFINRDFFNSVDSFVKAKEIYGNELCLDNLGIIKAIKNDVPVYMFPKNLSKGKNFIKDDQWTKELFEVAVTK